MLFSVLLGCSAWAAPLPKASPELKPGEEREFEVADGVKMKFVWIPGSQGKVTLGSPQKERDTVQAQLQIRGAPPAIVQLIDTEKEHEYEQKKGFWLAKYETTQAEWKAVMKTTRFRFHKDGLSANQVQGMDTNRFPADTVMYDDIYGAKWNDGDAPQEGSFLQKMNARPGAAQVFGAAGKFRLPTEDEWEYAYRGGKGNKQAYYWGDALQGDKANCNGDYPYGTEKKGTSLGRTAEVGSYEKAAPHPWGLCDMSGNVREWCENWSDSEHKYRALRGGTWDDGAWSCRAGHRQRFQPGLRLDGRVGFRLVFRLD
jgi:formylglycine-generating enzyme required for sulfatase activity